MKSLRLRSFIFGACHVEQDLFFLWGGVFSPVARHRSLPLLVVKLPLALLAKLNQEEHRIQQPENQLHLFVVLLFVRPRTGKCIL